MQKGDIFRMRNFKPVVVIHMNEKEILDVCRRFPNDCNYVCKVSNKEFDGFARDSVYYESEKDEIQNVFDTINEAISNNSEKAVFTLPYRGISDFITDLPSDVEAAIVVRMSNEFIMKDVSNNPDWESTIADAMFWNCDVNYTDPLTAYMAIVNEIIDDIAKAKGRIPENVTVVVTDDTMVEVVKRLYEIRERAHCVDDVEGLSKYGRMMIKKEFEDNLKCVVINDRYSLFEGQ